jgi:NAD(P)-dependent dehydrogenase (short-subunit alcohol dehydrogenase family)
MQQTILITGCSSGIGQALANELSQRGHRVYATARRPETLEGLAQAGCQTLGLDVNDEDSIAAVINTITRDVGSLDMLVNNAGFSQVGAVLDLNREDLRRQYETNVIAPVAMSRAAMALLQAAVAKRGTASIVNIGSIVGVFTTPFAGAYCSSKAALHSLSDALRMELKPFGIKVITVQPGGIRSAFGDHAEEALRLPPDSLFKGMETFIQARAQAGQQNAMPADEFVIDVADSLLQARPPSAIRGGTHSFKLPLLKRWLPTAAFDKLMAKNFGLDRFKPG